MIQEVPQHPQQKSAGESARADSQAIKPFRLKLQALIREEDLNLNQVFLQSLPVTTQAFKNEDKVPDKKMMKTSFHPCLGPTPLGTTNSNLS